MAYERYLSLAASGQPLPSERAGEGTVVRVRRAKPLPDGRVRVRLAGKKGVPGHALVLTPEEYKRARLDGPKAIGWLGKVRTYLWKKGLSR